MIKVNLFDRHIKKTILIALLIIRMREKICNPTMQGITKQPFINGLQMPFDDRFEPEKIKAGMAEMPN